MVVYFFLQLWRNRRQEEKRHKGVDEHVESMAVRTPEEPLSDQRRENHAGHPH